MSSCLSGAGGGGSRAAASYMLESLDIEMIKSASISSTTTTTTTTTSRISSSTASPSSTLSESGSPLTISTRKPRTPRKRPNQTYNEAAALLATAYPKIFPPTITDSNNFTKPSFSFEPNSSDLLVDTTLAAAAGFLLHRPNCSGPNNHHYEKAACRSPSEKCGELDFDAESIILDGEVMGEGIDCIMGDFSTNYDGDGNGGNSMEMEGGFCYGYPVGLGFEIGEIGMRKETRAIRNNGDEEGDWWRFPTVESTEKRRKKKVVAAAAEEIRGLETTKTKEEEEFVVPRLSAAELLLKLNHDAVLEAWSNKGSPFSDDVATVAGTDIQTRLAQIDLFGGIREASVLRYKEKRQNRLFSKKIRYQVRKVNADRRPRMKGRFVRTQNSNSSDD